MRSAAKLLVITLGLLSGCPQSTYGDAGVDVQPLMPRTFDVSASSGDAGPPPCDNALLQYANMSMAFCTHANEVCNVSSGPSNTVQCNCNAADGGMSAWVCQMPSH